MGREYPVRIETMDRVIDRALAQERMMGSLTACLGVAARLLAAVGLYGLMSYSVTRRTADIGIRMALGAPRGAIVRMITGEPLVLVAIGFVRGAPVIYAGSKLVSGLSFGLSPLDAVAPACRAASLDPVDSLKLM
jgi:predicted lysophospholipase L1 biosynthesis ABC-type transport system permease subunit